MPELAASCDCAWLPDSSSVVSLSSRTVEVPSEVTTAGTHRDLFDAGVALLDVVDGGALGLFREGCATAAAADAAVAVHAGTL